MGLKKKKKKKDRKRERDVTAEGRTCAKSEIKQVGLFTHAGNHVPGELLLQTLCSCLSLSGWFLRRGCGGGRGRKRGGVK